MLITVRIGVEALLSFPPDCYCTANPRAGLRFDTAAKLAGNKLRYGKFSIEPSRVSNVQPDAAEICRLKSKPAFFKYDATRFVANEDHDAIAAIWAL